MKHTAVVRSAASLLTIATTLLTVTVQAQGRRGGGADTLAASLTDPRVGLHPGIG